MRSALARLAAGVSIEELDVGADPALEARWGARLPVLLLDGHELCHYRLDAHVLRAIARQAAGANSL
jgi:hypothetical protein